jgi:hypothetical protein
MAGCVTGDQIVSSGPLKISSAGKRADDRVNSNRRVKGGVRTIKILESRSVDHYLPPSPANASDFRTFAGLMLAAGRFVFLSGQAAGRISCQHVRTCGDPNGTTIRGLTHFQVHCGAPMHQPLRVIYNRLRSLNSEMVRLMAPGAPI